MNVYHFRDWNSDNPWSKEQIEYLLDNKHIRMTFPSSELGTKTVADILDKNQYTKLTYDDIDNLAKNSNSGNRVVGVYKLKMHKQYNWNTHKFDLYWVLEVKQIHYISDKSDKILISDPTDTGSGKSITWSEFNQLYPPHNDPDGYYIKNESHPNIIPTFDRHRKDVIEAANKVNEHYMKNEISEKHWSTINPMFNTFGGKVKSRKKTKSKKRGKNKRTTRTRKLKLKRRKKTRRNKSVAP